MTHAIGHALIIAAGIGSLMLMASMFERDWRRIVAALRTLRGTKGKAK